MSKKYYKYLPWLIIVLSLLMGLLLITLRQHLIYFI